VLEQEVMIARVRDLAARDEALDAVLMYGSFTLFEGDGYSDIEFYLFFGTDLERIDRRGWLERIAPIEMHYLNEFGTDTVVFGNSVRGEFHFESAYILPTIAKWENAWFPSPDAAVLLDRTGELTHIITRFAQRPPPKNTAQTADFISMSLINWTLMGANLLHRGELAGALHLLGRVHKDLLKAVRILEETTIHWLTPSRHLEQDISAGSYERFRSCTSQLSGPDLRAAYEATWEWARELMHLLAAQHHLTLPENLLAQIDNRVASRPVTPEGDNGEAGF
jgi:lincosamide nucleotidyltransferase